MFSPLSPAECASRLAAVLDSDRLAGFSLPALFGSNPVIGRVTATSLRIHKRIGYRNSFQTCLTATMRAEAGGTLISGKFGMHPFVRFFMGFWFGGIILIGGSFSVVVAISLFPGSGHYYHDAWMGLVGPPVILAFGIGLVRFGRFLTRDESKFLTDFLVHALNARDRNRGD
jgi:hypothetical protein